MEEELLERINNLGIGTLGMGGRITALDVHIDYFPCHITALPVAVNLQCHASVSPRARRRCGVSRRRGSDGGAICLKSNP
jgi:tartrate dehydratase alpha subunit/fumarate hydratase class I-like protein